MQVKHLWLLVLALIAGSLLGMQLHPLAGVVFVSTLLAYVLLFSSARGAGACNSQTTDHAAAFLSSSTDVPTALNPLDEAAAVVNEVMLESTENLGAQIGIQSDAVNTLNQAFAQIKSLLEQQQRSMQRLLHEMGIDKNSDGISGRMNQEMEDFARQLMNALGNAVRALQFEDMSTQNIRYTIQRLEELVPIAVSLNGTGNGFSTLNDELAKYRESSLRQKHNPVSANSVSSGSVDLF